MDDVKHLSSDERRPPRPGVALRLVVALVQLVAATLGGVILAAFLGAWLKLLALAFVAGWNAI